MFGIKTKSSLTLMAVNIYGNVVMGDNVITGSRSSVVKDIPDSSTIVGN
jgi:serine acetyltransferase